METLEIDLDTLNTPDIMRLIVRFGEIMPEDQLGKLRDLYKTHVERDGKPTKEDFDGPSNLPDVFWGPGGRPTKEQIKQQKREHTEGLRKAISHFEEHLAVARRGLARLEKEGY